MYRHLDTLLDKGEFKNIRQRYAGKYPELSQFNHKLVNVIVTGAQNGANDAFDGIMNAFMAETPLPQSRHHARYLTPEIFPPEIRSQLSQIIIDEYQQDDIYRYAYDAGYKNVYPTIDELSNKLDNPWGG